MPEKKSQHFVPRFYLKNWSVGGAGKLMGVLNIPSRKLVPNAKLKTQARKDYFYGSNLRIEEALATIEGCASSVIAEAVSTRSLPKRFSWEHNRLLLFAITLMARTQYAADKIDEFADKLLKTIASDDARFRGKLDLVNIRLRNPVAFELKAAASHYLQAADLEYALVCSPPGSSFLTSDNPVVLYNQFLEARKTHGSNTGLAAKGLQIVLPLSPKHLLLFYDAGVYAVQQKKGRIVAGTRCEDVRWLNLLQGISAHSNLYFGESMTENHLRSMLAEAEGYRRSCKANVAQYAGYVDAEGLRHDLIHSYDEDVRCGLELSFVTTVREARKYRVGGKVVHLRNQEFSDAVRELSGRGECGKPEPSG